MASRNASRDRFKYGICLNEDCAMAKSKEVQQISMRSELVCKECGCELRECPPPKTFNPKPLIIALASLVVLGGGGTGAYFGFIKDKPAKETVEKVDKQDKGIRQIYARKRKRQHAKRNKQNVQLRPACI